MTIFRSSLLFFAGLATGCGSQASNYPDASTHLSKIVGIENFAEARIALKEFTEAGLDDPQKLKRDFVAAGFSPSEFADDKGRTCQSFHWKSKDLFPIVMIANICGDKVETNAGQQAP